MFQPFQPLRRALQRVGAAPYSFALGADGRGVAFRASVGKDKGHGILLAIRRDNPHHLRDHITGPLNDHTVANTDILATDFIFIMQGGVRHHHAANRDRRQPCHRCQRAGAPHLDINGIQQGFGLFGGEFMRQRPARGARDLAKPLLIVMPVDLVDHPVNIIAKGGPLAANLGIMRQQGVNIGAAGGQVIDAEAKAGEGGKAACMCIGNRGADLAKRIGKKAQIA